MSIVDGQIVVDQATLTVQAQPEDTRRAVVEDTQRLNSHTYAVGRTASDRWQESETENFYRVGHTSVEQEIRSQNGLKTHELA